MTLTQVFSHLDPTPAATLPWQLGFEPGDACVFAIKTDEGPRFMYLRVRPAPPQVPPGYLYGDVYSDLAMTPYEPGVAAVHPSEVLSPIRSEQFQAARRAGFRSHPEAVMAILNYSTQRGLA